MNQNRQPEISSEWYCHLVASAGSCTALCSSWSTHSQSTCFLQSQHTQTHSYTEDETEQSKAAEHETHSFSHEPNISHVLPPSPPPPPLQGDNLALHMDLVECSSACGECVWMWIQGAVHTGDALPVWRSGFTCGICVGKGWRRQTAGSSPPSLLSEQQHNLINKRPCLLFIAWINIFYFAFSKSAVLYSIYSESKMQFIYI